MRKRVLIINDEQGISKLLKINLEKNAISTDINGNGSSGLMKALNLNYDLIILKALLPDMNGFHVLKTLRQLKSTPVIMLSTQDDKNTMNFFLKSGANDVVVKPFSSMGVVEKVKQVVN